MYLYFCNMYGPKALYHNKEYIYIYIIYMVQFTLSDPVPEEKMTQSPSTDRKQNKIIKMKTCLNHIERNYTNVCIISTNVKFLDRK